MIAGDLVSGDEKGNVIIR